MSDTIHHDVELELTGCTPEPLMAYLKALGILRLVSEQKYPYVRGWWKNDMFWMRGSLNQEAIVEFFLDEYCPTPILAPWAGGSGFFKKDNKQAVESLCGGNATRCKPFADAILCVRQIIEEEKIGDIPKDDDKARLIRRFRRDLPDQVVGWIDAAMVLQEDGQGFSPLLGTGGNDGRLDFTQNFMQRLVLLGLHSTDGQNGNSRSWLNQSLFASPAGLNSASVGQFAPGRAGGANATQGMEGDSIDNPWDFIFMLEGAMAFAGAAVRRLDSQGTANRLASLCGGGATVRRLDSQGTGTSAFPFTAKVVGAGATSLSARDNIKPKQAKRDVSEIWMPLWERPTLFAEVAGLLAEGRVDRASGRHTISGTDFARAAATLGVDRGISQLCRYTLLMRNGQSFIAAPMGRFRVGEVAHVDLLREIDPWLDCFRRAANGKNAPPRFNSILRGIDSSIFEFCKYGGTLHFQKIIMALGAADRELANAEHYRKENKLRPLGGLSEQWSGAANDRSREFAVARSLASIYDADEKIGPIRANLEPVDWQNRSPSWGEKGRSVVWNSANLHENMMNVLQRRIMDGQRAGCGELPLQASKDVRLDAISMFIAGRLDADRICDLLWGLILIRHKGRTGLPATDLGMLAPPLPRAYAILKLLFLPRSLIIENVNDGRQYARLAGDKENGGITIRPEPAILSLLRGGRLGEALAIAARRLRSSGLFPMPQRRCGSGRDFDWNELSGYTGAIDSIRLAAALLIPIDSKSVNAIYHLCIRGEDISDNQATVDADAALTEKINHGN